MKGGIAEAGNFIGENFMWHSTAYKGIGDVAYVRAVALSLVQLKFQSYSPGCGQYDTSVPHKCAIQTACWSGQLFLDSLSLAAAL